MGQIPKPNSKRAKYIIKNKKDIKLKKRIKHKDMIKDFTDSEDSTN